MAVRQDVPAVSIREGRSDLDFGRGSDRGDGSYGHTVTGDTGGTARQGKCLSATYGGEKARDKEWLFRELAPSAKNK